LNLYSGQTENPFPLLYLSPWNERVREKKWIKSWKQKRKRKKISKERTILIKFGKVFDRLLVTGKITENSTLIDVCKACINKKCFSIDPKSILKPKAWANVCRQTEIRRQNKTKQKRWQLGPKGNTRHSHSINMKITKWNF
jgi:hypothetical protein